MNESFRTSYHLFFLLRWVECHKMVPPLKKKDIGVNVSILENWKTKSNLEKNC